MPCRYKFKNKSKFVSRILFPDMIGTLIIYLVAPSRTGSSSLPVPEPPTSRSWIEPSIDVSQAGTYLTFQRVRFTMRHTSRCDR